MTWISPTLTFKKMPERFYGTRRRRHVWPAAQYDLLWTERPGSLTIRSLNGRLQYRNLAKRAQEFWHTWICALTVLHSDLLSINSTSVGTALLLQVKIIVINLYKTGNIRLNITSGNCYIFWVSVYSPGYVACKAYTPCYIVKCGLFSSTTFFHITS
jgi:hypothetical protein